MILLRQSKLPLCRFFCYKSTKLSFSLSFFYYTYYFCIYDF